MLRVWHLRNTERLGGPERLLLDQCVLAAPGIQYTLLSFDTGTKAHPFLDTAEKMGVTIRRVPARSSYDLKTFKALRKLFKEERPDVLVGHDYRADLCLAYSARGLGIPRVAVAHGYTGENRKVRFFEHMDRRLLRKMDAVVVVSAPLRDRLEKAGVPTERIHRIANAVDVTRIAEAARKGRAPVRLGWKFDPEDRVLLCVGRLSPEKGQDLLLEAFATWQSQPGCPRVHLVFVGDGALRPSLEARAKQLRMLGTRVFFAGWRSDPHACIGAADAIVLPSRTEGLPIVLLEAMAAQRPVLATNVGDVAEVLDGGTYGGLVAKGSVEALTNALPGLFTVTGQEKARKALTRVQQAYSAAGQARALEALYRQVAAAREA